MFQGFIGLVQGSNRPYGTIKYGIYTIKYRTIRYRTVPYRTVEFEIGKTPPEGVLFPRTNSSQKLRATYFAPYYTVQLNTRIIYFRVEGTLALGEDLNSLKKHELQIVVRLITGR